MKYVMEIRDLTNEGKQLEEIREITRVNCETMTKEINILAESHYKAICSYFEHLFHEIDKLEVYSFEAVNFGGSVSLYYNKNNQIRLFIRNTISRSTFVWKDGDWSNALYSALYKDKDCFSTLLDSWKLFKEAVNSSINKTIASIEKDSTRKNSDIAHTLNCYKNFEI